MTRIRVKLDARRERSYTVEILPGLLTMLPRRLARMMGGGRVFIITDTRVARLYGRGLRRNLRTKGVDARLIAVAPGERSKNSSTVNRLHTRLLHGEIGRDSTIVALGGGVVGDLAGYVAATVLRGVRLIQVPTTLLAQVDSSVGGKVGIDHPAGKNLIGAFYQPTAVFIDPLLLRTLPEREFRNGMAEVVKIAAALDRHFFDFIAARMPAIMRREPEILNSVIARSVRLKGHVVERDEYEAGLRKTLNLGHTFGHALEASSGFRVKHGYAVAIGLASESALAVRMGILREAERVRLLSVLRAAGLPTRMPKRVVTKAFLDALAMDKKNVGGETRFVLLTRIGSCATGAKVPTDLVRNSALGKDIYRGEEGIRAPRGGTAGSASRP
ncbi:MAG: 3-dehydroquinate synthase [Bacteroidota bacterium]